MEEGGEDQAEGVQGAVGTSRRERARQHSIAIAYVVLFCKVKPASCRRWTKENVLHHSGLLQKKSFV